MFGNTDQLTTRHDFGGNVAFLDGSAQLLKLPSDRQETVASNLDFEGNDLYANAGGSNKGWKKISDRNQWYGWINSAKN